jgi:hypothetical protein
MALCQAAAGKRLARKRTDLGWEQNRFKSRALGRKLRQWHLLNCQGLLVRAKFLSTLLTPFMRNTPWLGS